jgi:hypothetical protein
LKEHRSERVRKDKEERIVEAERKRAEEEKNEKKMKREAKTRKMTRERSDEAAYLEGQQRRRKPNKRD